jgi:TPR repeat protein|tara:strand:+ start:117 stop:524 length:408 start_codon:yes stop_codon:yes gene_type:complete
MSLLLFKNRISFETTESRLDKVEKRVQKALDLGDSEPAFILGNAFNEPDDPNFPKNAPYDVCLQNFTKAVYWLEKAVDAGHADAMVLMGTKYIEGGSGVQQDKEKGIELLKRADAIGTTPPGMAKIALNMLGVAA